MEAVQQVLLYIVRQLPMSLLYVSASMGIEVDSHYFNGSARFDASLPIDLYPATPDPGLTGQRVVTQVYNLILLRIGVLVVESLHFE